MMKPALGSCLLEHELGEETGEKCPFQKKKRKENQMEVKPATVLIPCKGKMVFIETTRAHAHACSLRGCQLL